MQKIEVKIPIKIKSEANMKYYHFLMGLEPEERKEFLAKADAEDAAERTYFCKSCKSAGFIYHPTIDKNDEIFGKTILCPDCQGKGNTHNSTGLVPRHWDMTFEHWFSTPGTSESLRLAKDWSNPAEASFIWLLLYGQHGCGKTHLARAAQFALRNRNRAVTYVYAVNLFDDLRRSLDSKTLDDRLKFYRETEYLIIDDLGAQKETDWTTEKLEGILNYRYENYCPTMITLNGNPDILPGAIYSRFRDTERARMSLNKGGDYRPKK